MDVPADPHGQGVPDAALDARLRRINRIAVAGAISWIIITAAGTAWLSERSLTNYLSNAALDARDDTKAITNAVDHTFDELAAMPQVIANSAELAAIVGRYSAHESVFAALPAEERTKELLRDPEVSRVNAKLTAVRNELDYDLIYALDNNGVRVVSSDWDQQLTLLGDRLDDREDFKTAIQDKPGNMFAVARTTMNPVLSFSAPIEGVSGPIGVMVVRQDSDALGPMLAAGHHLAMIVDKAGVIVASSRKELALSHLGELGGPRPDAATARDIYAQDPMHTLELSKPSHSLNDAEWLFEGQPYLVSTSDLKEKKYRLVVLTPIESLGLVQPLHYGLGVLVALFGVAIALLGRRRAESLERRRHSERVTAALNEKLIALNKDKDRYLGIAAHDLRNPLSSMRGLAELMAETPLEPEQSREFLQTIRSTSDEMLHLVNDLLDTAVIESGKLEVKRQDQDVSALVRRRIRNLEPQAARKQIALNVDAPKGNAAIDAARFGQVIDNLISNAIKFSPSGTTVRIGVRFEADRFIFSVQDQGPGIPAADRALMFRSFQKLSAQPTGGEKSTGLGLAIVKKIVDAHGGTIAVDDAPGGGTLFTVTTPVAYSGAQS